MTQKQNLRVLLIFSLFFLSLGGWLLHSRIHPLIAVPGMETGLVDTTYPDDHLSFLFRPFDAVSYLPQLRNISAGNELRINT
jgi:hypothetical protein